jgi:acetyl esterase/lipase
MASLEVETLIALLRENRMFAGASIESYRASMDSIIESMPVKEDVRFESVEAGGVPAEWTRVDGTAEDRILLYFHGGGYCVGSPATHRLLVGNLSRTSDALGLSVDYRLAPEHPFPAVLEDAQSAYRHLLDAGFEPNRIVIAGDSAGGGIVAGLQLRLREARMPLPAAAVLISPWLDLTNSAETFRSRADADVMLTKENADRFAAWYLSGADPKTPSASPIFADLAGLPPQLVHVGDAEVLLDDSLTYAKKAKAAGVDVTLEVWDDMIHVFPAFEGFLPQAGESIEKIGKFVKRHTL